LLTASRLLTFVSVGALWGLSCVAPEFVRVVLGSQWDAAVYPLQIMCLTVPLQMLGGIFNTGALGLGRGDLVLRNSAVSAMVLPVAFYIGVRWGPDGLATAYVLAVPVAFVANFPRLARALGITVREVFAAVWASLLAGAIMAASVTAARTAASGLGETMRLPLLVVLGAVIYLGVALTLDKRIRPEIRRLLAAL
jgi:O-antigen/teichoic acid export membrane protein